MEGFFIGMCGLLEIIAGACPAKRSLIVFRDGGDHPQIVRVLHQRMGPAGHLQP